MMINHIKAFLILIILLFVSVIVSLFLFHKHNQLALKAINAYMDGQETERKRLSGHLHDTLMANLTAVHFQFILLKNYVPVEHFDKILNILKNNIKEARDIAHGIMPPVLLHNGLITAIKTKIQSWDNESLSFELKSSIEEIQLYDELKIALYRCISECVNNILKYADASKVNIEFILCENNFLDIKIQDNGVGFNMRNVKRKNKTGLGIYGMESRIKYFNGKFQIQSKQGIGTIVSISVPIEDIK